MDHPSHADQSELCTVATDDIILIGRYCCDRVPNFGSLQAGGILAEEVIALGCVLSSQPHVAERLFTRIAASF